MVPPETISCIRASFYMKRNQSEEKPTEEVEHKRIKLDDSAMESFQKELDVKLVPAYIKLLKSEDMVLTREILESLLYLLICVVSKSALKEAITSKMSRGEEIVAGLTEKEVLVLRDAFLRNDWEYILNIEQLQLPVDVALGMLRLEDLPATAQAWSVSYRGHAADNLEQYLKISRSLSRFSGMITTIVQSSGTGKSRTVDELSKHIFSLPFCLRRVRDDFGFPKSDANAVAFFEDRETGTFHECEIRFYLFFKALFRFALEEISHLGDVDSQNFVQRWHEHMKPELGNRDRLHQSAYDKAREEFSDLVGKPIGFFSSRALKYEEYRDSMSKIREASDQMCESMRKLLKEICRIRGKQFESLYGGKQLPYDNLTLFIYFDEADWLYDIYLKDVRWAPKDVHREAHTCLLSVLESLKDFKIFSLFLTSAHKIRKFSPPKPDSLSWMTSEIVPQAPFTELFFDLGEVWNPTQRATIVEEGEDTLDEMCKIAYMVRFGRPFFAAIGKYVDSERIIHIAQHKIRNDEILNHDGRMAAISIRLSVEFDLRRREARKLARDLVKSHMRVAYSIPMHREYIQTGTPSEPILAEAAAQILHKIEKAREMILDDLLTENDVFLEKGQLGELLARTLLTFAHDQVVEEQARELDEKPFFSTPIPFIDFIKALFQADVAERILDARPQNIPNGKTLRDAFRDACVRFTHFSQMASGAIFTDQMAFAAICRAMAWTFNRKRSAIDIGIPIFLGSNNEKVKSAKMTMLFIRMKGDLDGQTPHIDVDTLEHRFFTQPEDDEDDKRPYIFIMMDLGKVRCQDKRRSSYKDPKSLTISPNGTAAAVHPRYMINAHGCSSTVYGVLSESQGNVCAQILRSREPLSEHLRSSKVHDDVISNMKPFRDPGVLFPWVKWRTPDVLPTNRKVRHEGGEEESEGYEGVDVEEYAEGQTPGKG